MKETTSRKFNGEIVDINLMELAADGKVYPVGGGFNSVMVDGKEALILTMGKAMIISDVNISSSVGFTFQYSSSIKQVLTSSVTINGKVFSQSVAHSLTKSKFNKLIDDTYCGGEGACL